MIITTNLPVQEVNKILGALAKLPYEDSAALITEIKRQAETQIVQAQDAAKEPQAADVPAVETEAV